MRQEDEDKWEILSLKQTDKNSLLQTTIVPAKKENIAPHEKSPQTY